ncbi:MAG: ATP-dependent zinc metalloprotease FtsH [Chitinispirillaceae bacterium]|nr:ATP-dependent zinc metalloprotease FtsH [Chitinispirillaceae bacterium]
MNEAKKRDCPPGSDKDCGVKKIPPFLPPLNKKQFHFSLWYFLAGLLLLNVLNNYFFHTPEQTIDFSEFKAKIISGQIKRVEMSSRYYIGLTYGREELKQIDGKGLRERSRLAKETVFRTIPVPESQIVPLLDSMKIEYFAKSEQPNRFVDLFFTWVIPLLIMIFIWRFLFKRMGNLGQGVMAFGQNRAHLVAEGDTGTTFNDVAGADEAKEELVEVVDFLKTPEKYTAIGGKVPKGVLLVGPPGTGKTLLARAVAGEAKVAFFRMSGADFVEMFVGVGAARVRDLFKQARDKAPCIVFIDELDAIGKSRAPIAGGNDEREQTLNQLLVEMDGFDARSGVIILAATNRPEVLDPALLRPGRFDRQVLVDKPDLNGREAILKIHIKGVSLDDSVDLKAVARSTAGFAGADLANIVNEAALLAVRAGRQKVAQEDFEEAIEKVMAGLKKKNRLINSKERRIVAYHETGHALTAAFTPDSDPVQKISIVPRGFGALGYTMQLPTEDRFLMTEKELLGKIDVLLGGRAAEQLIFNEISTGASNDIEKATDIARRMVTDYGMSEKYGNMVLRSRRGPMFLGDQGAFDREYSEEAQRYVDEQVARIIGERYDHVKSLLAEKKNELETIAGILLEKETVNAGEFKELIGEKAGAVKGDRRAAL